MSERSTNSPVFCAAAAAGGAAAAAGGAPRVYVRRDEDLVELKELKEKQGENLDALLFGKISTKGQRHFKNGAAAAPSVQRAKKVNAAQQAQQAFGDSMWWFECIKDEKIDGRQFDPVRGEPLAFAVELATSQQSFPPHFSDECNQFLAKMTTENHNTLKTEATVAVLAEFEKDLPNFSHALLLAEQLALLRLKGVDPAANPASRTFEPNHYNSARVMLDLTRKVRSNLAEGQLLRTQQNGLVTLYNYCYHSTHNPSHPRNSSP